MVEVTDKRYHIKLYRVHFAMCWFHIKLYHVLVSYKVVSSTPIHVLVSYQFVSSTPRHVLVSHKFVSSTPRHVLVSHKVVLSAPRHVLVSHKVVLNAPRHVLYSNCWWLVLISYIKVNPTTKRLLVFFVIYSSRWKKRETNSSVSSVRICIMLRKAWLHLILVFLSYLFYPFLNSDDFYSVICF